MGLSLSISHTYIHTHTHTHTHNLHVKVYDFVVQPGQPLQGGDVLATDWDSVRLDQLLVVPDENRE